ncbi:hypothetical protein NEOLEDRAFT_1097856 [Neolentinus lepideus HHB14362 ss-1]|uniref:CREG-like beta-barrel domain-containing protein n=1 Tax=Neolentinus lepideus HHB14362 ss-1 TaxID=1314782 RepID=A0A165QGU8_9AGAM|nr:hypothetical protein NEOLEDRAFT_1097856 [Neolentinus lepideus HHB14362 ss-1]
MHAVLLLVLFALGTAGSPNNPRSIFINSVDDDAVIKIPTVHESAVQARRIMHLSTIGTLSTVFPTTDALEDRPSGLGGVPIGLMDYFADCEPETGNPTILAVDIATSFKNAAAGSNVTLSMRWVSPDSHSRVYSPAALPRFSLVGYLEELSDEDVESGKIAECFVQHHRDAKVWLPGSRIHRSRWVRLVVNDVYWIGGFGDRAYIGWIPVEVWRNVTVEEVHDATLPGDGRGLGFTLINWFRARWF